MIINFFFFINSANCIQFLFVKNSFYHSQDQFFCWNLTWQNLKGQAELNNLTVLVTAIILTFLTKRIDKNNKPYVFLFFFNVENNTIIQFLFLTVKHKDFKSLYEKEKSKMSPGLDSIPNALNPYSSLGSKFSQSFQKFVKDIADSKSKTVCFQEEKIF